MGKIILPGQVKLFIGILVADISIFHIVEEKLSHLFGPIDLRTSPEGIPFTFTDYYTNEMGSDLKRFFSSFERLIKPDDITDIKIKTNELEDITAKEVKSSDAVFSTHPCAIGRPASGGKVTRPVNLDPGYLTASKVVLATTKDYSHRIHIRDGIYAEITLQYRTIKGSGKGFQPMPWTYPDYQTREYLDFFYQMRQIYLKPR